MNIFFTKYHILCWMLFFTLTASAQGLYSPKREFRGVWLQTVNRSEFQKMTPAQLRGYFMYMLDEFEKTGINAIVFQVRPKADAFYESSYEPWSDMLTGTQGNAPHPYWDPMAFLIDECHKRNMEFHAWINPYRVTYSKNDYLCRSHIFHQHPDWFVRYDGNVYFDPGVPECRDHICNIVKDIVSRYDVDAIHMDDYFYPYPKNGLRFPDQASFSTYGYAQGYYPNRLDDWRRNNVNLLVREIKATIINTNKPWVKFGISPFGIYRNKKNTPDGTGSNTNGMQNYDDLFADVLCWLHYQWIDYLVPQLYWEIGNKSADYETLVRWWSRQDLGRVHLYIGQDIERCLPTPRTPNVRKDQLARKMKLGRFIPNVGGNLFWYGYGILDNLGHIKDSLTSYHHYPALIPPSTHLTKKLMEKEPHKPSKLKAEWTAQGYKLTWEAKKGKTVAEDPLYFCIYRFEKKEKEDFADATNIVKITRDTEYLLPYRDGRTSYKYVVTSVNRFHYESRSGKKINVKL